MDDDDYLEEMKEDQEVSDEFQLVSTGNDAVEKVKRKSKMRKGVESLLKRKKKCKQEEVVPLV